VLQAVAHIGRLIIVGEVIAVVLRRLRPDAVAVAVAAAMTAKARCPVEVRGVVCATQRGTLVAAAVPAPILTAGCQGKGGENRKKDQGMDGFHGADDLMANFVRIGQSTEKSNPINPGPAHHRAATPPSGQGAKFLKAALKSRIFLFVPAFPVSP
jgi:hypothetical protein